MKITKEAIELLNRIVFSCDPIGKEKDQQNEQFIAQCSESGLDMDFDKFRSGLMDGDEREKNISVLADELGKKDVDYEVICRYFGGENHTHKTLLDLDKENIYNGTKFALYMVFIHLLTPVRIKKIDHEKKLISAVYENKEALVEIKGLLFLPEDERVFAEGGICLVHYPLVVDASPDPAVIQTLLEMQRSDKHFMKACQCFKDGIDHSKYAYFDMLRKRM